MDTLIHYGSAIKAIEENESGWKFGGWLVVFDTQDVSSQRDRFTKSTDFDIRDGDRRSIYYNHGLDGTMKRTRLGDCTLQIKDSGVWIEGEIKKRKDYLARHAEQIALNIKHFGLSSGAPAHLVERKSDADGGHEVLLWPIAEASITPTPAEPLTGCVSLKSLMESKVWDESRHPRDEKGRFSGGAIAASPHIGTEEGDKDSLSYQEAIGRVGSERHQVFLKAIDWIHEQLGIASESIDKINGAGMYQGSGENSVFIRYSEDVSADKVEQAAAMMGYVANQKEVLITTPDNNGPHATYIIDIPEGKMDVAFATAEKEVRESGNKFQAYSLMPDKDNPKQGKLIIAESERSPDLQKYADSIGEVVGEKPQVGRGFTEAIGNPIDRKDAQRKYKEVIDENRRGMGGIGKEVQEDNAQRGVRGDGIQGSKRRHNGLDTWRGQIGRADPRSPAERGQKSLSERGQAGQDGLINYQFTVPRSDQLVDLSFEAHSDQALAAVGALKTRIEALADLRCIKSQRRWSAAKYAQLSDIAAELATSAAAIKTIAETHSPQHKKDSDIERLTLETLWEYELTRARLNGVDV